MTAADWADAGAKSVAMVLSGSAEPDIGDDGAPQVDDDLALLINAWWEPLTFAVSWDCMSRIRQLSAASAGASGDRRAVWSVRGRWSWCGRSEPSLRPQIAPIKYACADQNVPVL